MLHVEKGGVGHLAMSIGRELLNDFPVEVLVAHHRQAGQRHIPAQGRFSKGTSHQLALKGVGCSNKRHCVVDRNDVLLRICLAIIRCQYGGFEIIWNDILPNFLGTKVVAPEALLHVPLLHPNSSAEGLGHCPEEFRYAGAGHRSWPAIELDPVDPWLAKFETSLLSMCLCVCVAWD